MQTIVDLCEGLPEQTFSAGEVLLPEGGRTGRLYILLDGEIEVLKGDIQIHVSNEAGAVFGEISALLDIPHIATARTLKPTRAYVVNDASNFLRTNQQLAFGLCKLMAQRVHGMTSYLADLKSQFQDHDSHLGMVHKVLSSLMHHPDEPFEPGSDRYPDRSL